MARGEAGGFVKGSCGGEGLLSPGNYGDSLN